MRHPAGVEVAQGLRTRERRRRRRQRCVHGRTMSGSRAGSKMPPPPPPQPPSLLLPPLTHACPGKAPPPHTHTLAVSSAYTTRARRLATRSLWASVAALRRKRRRGGAVQPAAEQALGPGRAGPRCRQRMLAATASGTKPSAPASHPLILDHPPSFLPHPTQPASHPSRPAHPRDLPDTYSITMAGGLATGAGSS